MLTCLKTFKFHRKLTILDESKICHEIAKKIIYQFRNCDLTIFDGFIEWIYIEFCFYRWINVSIDISLNR